MSIRPHDGPDRLPPIPAAEWSDAQLIEAEAMLAGPRRAILPPFELIRK